jgi:hypothetical protein
MEWRKVKEKQEQKKIIRTEQYLIQNGTKHNEPNKANKNKDT